MSEKIDLTKIGSLTGISYKTIKKRLQDHRVEPVGESGKSILYDSAAALAAVFSARRTDGPDDLDLTQERAILAREQSRKLSRENDIEEGKVAPLSALTEALQWVGRQIVVNLEALPLEMKKLNPRLTGHDIQSVKKSIAKCCNAIAEMDLSDCPDPDRPPAMP